MKEQTISLCMIVKNEEEMLPRCLRSVEKYVDEIIVVDTGSTDRTVEIAESFGARVFHHPWEDHFSKHRNQSIQHATGDWFMYLDADEEIIDGTGPIIREAVKNQEEDSITFEFISLYAGDKKGLHTQERLFRNHRGIRFEGRIHNRVIGVKSTCLYPIRVLHHGYNVAGEKGKLKHERRLRILQKEIHDNPNDPRYHHYLAASHISAPDYEEAANESLLAISLAEKSGDAGAVFYAWTHYIAATSLIHLQDFQRAEEVIRSGLKRFPNDLDLHFSACQIAFESANDEALTDYAERYMTLHRDISANPVRDGMAHCVTYDQAWRIHWFLSMNHLSEGYHEAHESEMKKAFAMAADRAEVHLETGRYLMKKGDYSGAGVELEKAFHGTSPNQDVLYSLIELCIRREDQENEIKWWQELLIRFPDKKERMIEQAELALAERRWNNARKMLIAILAGHPKDERVLRLMVRCSRGLYDSAEETRYLEQLVAQHPNFQEDIIRLAFLLIESKRAPESIHYLRTILSEDPNHVSAHLGYALLNWREGRIEPCIRELDLVLRSLGVSCDQEISSRQDLGLIFSVIGEKFKEIGINDWSLLAFMTSLEMDCHLPEIYRGTAEVLRREGRLKEALECLQTALRLSEHPSSEILLQMGDTYLAMGNSRAADFCYQKGRNL